MILTSVAIALALITAFLFFRYLNSLEREVGEKIEVVVAAQEIPARTLITEYMVKLDEIPRKYARDSYLQYVEQVVGFVPLISLSKGDILQRNALVKDRVPPERRAMAIAVDQVTGVGGLLVGGDRVDILVSYTGADGSNMTTLLLNDIEILEVPGQPSAMGGGLVGVVGEALVPEEFSQLEPFTAGTTVVLTLGLEDAMKLTYMDNFAEEVRLILRRHDDKTSPSVQPVTLDDFK